MPETLVAPGHDVPVMPADPAALMTRDAFDAAAPVYDRTYEHLPGIRHIRSVMRTLYLRHFRPGDSLLELNCGTGIDAFFLAKRGMTIHATDISPGMIVETRRRFALAGLPDRLRADIISYLELDRLPEGMYDGAYSNLGGLNCTDRLHVVAEGLSRRLRPGAFFVAAVMSDFCLWETAAALLRADFGKAFRRLRRHGCVARLHGGLVRTYYFSPADFRKAFQPWFSFVGVVGLNVLIPPPNSDRAYRFLGRSISLLEKCDRAVAGLAPFTGMGDHFAIILRRTER